MGRRWFKHGKWPKVLVGLHYYSMVSFALLLLSGLALYLPSVHTPLIPYIPYIYTLHILLGIIFAVTLITPFLNLLPKGKRLGRLDWGFPLVFGTGIVLTGLLVWQVTWFPSVWRSAGFLWHGYLSYILGGWLIVHAFVKAIGVRPTGIPFAAPVDRDRRGFVKAIAWGGIGTFVLTVFDPVGVLRTLFQSRPAVAGAANPPVPRGGAPFGAYYTVTGGYPTMSTHDYRLQIDGLVEGPTVLDWNAVMALPKVREVENFQCVTGWSVPNVHWEGVHLKEIAQLVRPLKDAAYVHFYSFDGQYTESLSLKEAFDDTVLLATHLNGAPLPTAQGAPLRLIVPKMYGYKSIKWVSRVSFAKEPLIGYWEQRGYANEAFIGSYHGLF